MNNTQKEAWGALKLAVDKYSQATGAEIAVATTFFPVASSNDNYMAFNNAKSVSSQKTTVYGHGSLMHQIKKGLDITSRDTNIDNVDINIDNATTGQHIPVNGQAMQLDPMSRSLSSSFRTLKLDMLPQRLKSGTSGSIIGASSPIDLSPDHDSIKPVQPKSQLKGGRKKSKRKKNKNPSGEFEMDDNLLFGEEENDASSDEDDNSYDESDESEDGIPPNLTPRHLFNPPMGGQRAPLSAQNMMSSDQFATSLPVNINLAWGHHNQSSTRFRDNQGPHPPTFHQPIRANPTGPKIIQADKTPQLDTMMASMQALARSVTDDSAMIFGDRPRPRLHVESSRNKNVKF